MSANPSFGGTITTGIQDISALLPLLGTEQCESHVGSALTDGYIYAAAAPISVFGSLGMARAGFKALVASISIPRWRFVGAEKLQDAGFAPSGKNLSLIMIDPDGAGCHLAETRLDSLLNELHIEDVEKLRIETTCGAWNIKMATSTFLLCAVSLLPYVYLNRDGNKLPRSASWTFPVIRALGGFLTSSGLQILIQQRLSNLLKQRLIFRILDPLVETIILRDLRGSRIPQWNTHKPSEICLWNLEQYLSDLNAEVSGSFFQRLGWAFQNILGRRKGGNVHDAWSSGPSEKNVPPVHANFMSEGSLEDVELGKSEDQQCHLDWVGDLRTKFIQAHNRFPISETSWLFLILVSLGICASVIGYVGCFSVVQGAAHSRGPLIWLAIEATLSIVRVVLWSWNPASDNPNPIKFSLELSSYPPLSTCNKSGQDIHPEKTLPLVRAPEFLESFTAYAGLLSRFDDPGISLFYTLTRKAADAPGIYERVLYITLFDHKERTTRVYHEDTMHNVTFWSADTLTVDIAHRILQTKIRSKIDPVSDPIASNNNLRSALHQHYRSILDRLQYRDRDRPNVDKIENYWTLKIADTPKLQTTGQDAPEQVIGSSKYCKSAINAYKKRGSPLASRRQAPPNDGVDSQQEVFVNSADEGMANM